MVTDRARRQTFQTPAALLLLLFGCLSLAGCGVTYLAQATRGQLQLLRAREPLAVVLARPATPPALHDQLLQVQRIRDFASRELGLPDNASYRSYADIGRPFVVWNVVATPRYSIDPRQWCFPVAGCVAYRGYFRQRAAERFAARLQGGGDDVLLGGVPAYSTLGRFADPVINTMTGYGEYELAAMIFHELAHQVAYLPGDSAFNEAFATAVEEAGIARYAQSRGAPAALTNWRAQRERREAVAALFIARRRELGEFYAAGGTDEQLEAGKRRILAALAQDLRAYETRSGRRSGYASWVDAGLNNAHLASVATYYGELPYFETLWTATAAICRRSTWRCSGRSRAARRKNPGDV